MSPGRYQRSTRRIQHTAGPPQPFFQPATSKEERAANEQGGFFTPVPVVQGTSPIPGGKVQRKCTGCEKEEKEKVQRKENSASGQTSEAGSAAPSIVSSVLSSGEGRPLDAGTRKFMESRFGQDFGQVRIHTDGRAAESASAIQARAYTSGRDVVFGEGEYQPSSESGRRLLAHELAHVGQQDKACNTVQRMSHVDALAYGRSLERRYPGWLNVLPSCPCTYPQAQASPVFEGGWLINNFITNSYHPGTANQVRSKKGYQSDESGETNHGQQCCYDERDNLITEGPGAGTPDVWSATAEYSKHQEFDVSTFNRLGWRIYNQYWIPNNGNNCPSNSGEGRRQISERIPRETERKIVRIRELLAGWTSEDDLLEIIRIIRSITDRDEMRRVRENISPILVSELSDIGDRTRVRVELARRP